MKIVGCMPRMDLEKVNDNGYKGILAFIYSSDYWRLWPDEYIPVTLMIDDAEKAS